MFYIVGITRHGGCYALGSKQFDTRDAAFEAFPREWTESARHCTVMNFERYGIAQLVEFVEMTQSPVFEAKPIINALPKPEGSDDQIPF